MSGGIGGLFRKRFGEIAEHYAEGGDMRMAMRARKTEIGSFWAPKSREQIVEMAQAAKASDSPLLGLQANFHALLRILTHPLDHFNLYRDMR